MATHSRILAWRIPWTGDPAGYSPWGCKESDTAEQARASSIEHGHQVPSSVPGTEDTEVLIGRLCPGKLPCPGN